jgi:hypothetical protein
MSAHQRIGHHRQKAHTDNVKRKYERIQGLKDLILTHELADEFDAEYVRGLKRRLRSTENYFKAMRP